MSTEEKNDLKIVQKNEQKLKFILYCYIYQKRFIC